MISGLLKKIFGDKTAKERKEYQPIIDKANEFFNSFKSISDDELRARTVFFQDKVKQYIQPLEDELAELNKIASDISTPIHEKEALFEKIDKQVKLIDDKIEEVLVEIMPEAFAVVKETARSLKVH